jgi:hypothetical protein
LIDSFNKNEKRKESNFSKQNLKKSDEIHINNHEIPKKDLAKDFSLT